MTYLPSPHKILGPVLAVGLLVAALCLASGAQARAIGAFTTKGAWKFTSAPELHPPKLKVLSRKGGLAPGDFLVANLPNEGFQSPLIGEGGPIIYDNKLRPVWALGVGTKVGAADLQQESYLAPGSATAEPVLVWWEGVVNGSGITTQGKVTVVNEAYRKVATLTAHKPWTISLHDASINGPNIWVTVYRLVTANLKHYHSASHAKVYDVGVQEYNLATGKLLYTWDALNPGHKANVPLSQSKQPAPSAKAAKHGAYWDAYHINSAQALPNGNVLISMRNTWGVYLLNPATNKVLWTLGGKNSSFSIKSAAKFAWQHHAELVDPTTGGIAPSEELTLFNDNCTVPFGGLVPTCKGGHPSTGLILKLNTVTHKAKLVKAYSHKPPIRSPILGSMETLPGGNALVGFGGIPYFSEYSKSGKPLLDVQFPGSIPGTIGPGKDQSYRVLYTDAPTSGACAASASACWVGTPWYKPSGAVRKASGKTTVFASWNGATQVARWTVLAGHSTSHLKSVATKHRNGFETSIGLKKAYSVYEVQALDSHGTVLGTSKPFAK